ncbi:hypothetical protein KPSA3_02792 [Pseudomonas syringae pv. actinidiae]|uniref:Uncharacterized protein n=1 Tax=Pseudomonas syringae pv. actinidiae TaxID=103796 RepID=A0AAN4Q714_PSESF|nr:hypothetical protein KPSA3_02792 [Pseudomonas syringae pv. actinidiae]
MSSLTALHCTASRDLLPPYSTEPEIEHAGTN